MDRAAAGFAAARERDAAKSFGMFSCSKATNEMNCVAQKFTRAVMGSNNIGAQRRGRQSVQLRVAATGRWGVRPSAAGSADLRLSTVRWLAARGLVTARQAGSLTDDRRAQQRYDFVAERSRGRRQ